MPTPPPRAPPVHRPLRERHALESLHLRLTADELAWIDAFATARRCTRTQAMRALLAVARAHVAVDGTQVSDALHQVHARLSDLVEGIDGLSGSFEHLNDTFGKVWVESLMAGRLLLDAQNRGLIERVRDLTARYLERLAEP